MLIPKPCWVETLIPLPFPILFFPLREKENLLMAPQEGNRTRARNRLRNIYEQEKRRTSRLNESRNSNRGGRQVRELPTRVVVSERRTRREGFGRGGAQAVGRSDRRRRGNNNNDNGQGQGRRRFQRRLSDKFADKNLFRSGNRDRFNRNEKAKPNTSNNRRVERTKRGGKRFIRGRRDGQGQGQGQGRRNNRREGKKDISSTDLDKQLNNYQGGAGNAGGRNEARGRGGKRGPVTKEDLDAQLDAFHKATEGGGIKV
jgi:hypothetical protein